MADIDAVQLRLRGGPAASDWDPFPVGKERAPMAEPSHVHSCPECYEHVPCEQVCTCEPDLTLSDGTPCGAHLVCDACEGHPRFLFSYDVARDKATSLWLLASCYVLDGVRVDLPGVTGLASRRAAVGYACELARQLRTQLVPLG